MNTVIKCWFCNTSSDHTFERVPLLRVDSNFLKKIDFICMVCKNNNVNGQLLLLNDSIDAITRSFDDYKSGFNESCNRIFNLEKKLNLLYNNLDEISSSLDRIEDCIAANTKSIALSNLGNEKYFAKIIKFIDNFDLIINEAVSNKVESIVSGIKNNLTNIQHNNKLTTDNMNNNALISKHLASNTELITRLSNEFNSRISVCAPADASSSRTIDESLIVRLEKELRSTSDACHDLTNFYIHKPAVTPDRANVPNLHQELFPALDINLPNISLTPLITPANIDTNSSNSQHSSSNNVDRPCILRAAPKPKIIFVSRLCNNTTDADVISHVSFILNRNNIQGGNVKCKNISRFNGQVASFKLTVPEAVFDLLLSPESWPETTYLKEFVDLRNNNNINNIAVPKNLNACPSTTRT